MNNLQKRVRIIFINCPTLSTEAASYLLLAQNKFQRAIQYEIVHYWIYSHSSIGASSYFEKFIEKISERSSILDRWYKARIEVMAAPAFSSVIYRNNWYEPTKEAISKHDQWFKNSTYSKFDLDSSPTIVITEAPIEGGYIGLSQDRIALISLAKWKTYFKPGSALEYLLRGTQRYALRLCYGPIGSHYATRGCIWDYNVYQRDTKISGHLGYLCSTCETLIKRSTDECTLKSIKYMVSNEWIGDTSDLSSVASIINKNYKYDLKRSTGLHTSLFTEIGKSMKSDAGKFFFDIAKVALAALATLYIASQFPEIYKILHGN